MTDYPIPKSFTIKQGDFEFTISNVKYLQNPHLLAQGQLPKPNLECFVKNPRRLENSREMYLKLMDLVDEYNVKLTKNFNIYDDPDEMKVEYDMHMECINRNKNNQVKFYKSMLLNIVCGMEFLNEKYNLFGFQLKGWSKQIASDMDDYTEVLGELYEKYKNNDGKMTPENRLLFMIIMSGITFHLSQKLFGSSAMNETIQNNPNILNNLLGRLMKG